MSFEYPLYYEYDYSSFIGGETEAQRAGAPLFQWVVGHESNSGCFGSQQLDPETALNDLLRSIPD